MAIVVGKDSYVSVEQANAAVAMHCPMQDAARLCWEALDALDKEVYLRRAAMAMNGLIYRGVKKDPMQPMAFPRQMMGRAESEESCETPGVICMAQALEALELACPGEDSMLRQTRTGAVTAYSIGHLSEQLALAKPDSLEATIASKAAQKLIEPYVCGGFETR